MRRRAAISAIAAACSAVLAAELAGHAAAATSARPPGSTALLATMTGERYRTVDGHGDVGEWVPVADEASATVSPGQTVEVQGWAPTCILRDAEWRAVAVDDGLISASCAPPDPPNLTATVLEGTR